MTISGCGGDWSHGGSGVGTVNRLLINSSTNFEAAVAYKDKNTTLSARMVFLMI